MMKPIKFLERSNGLLLFPEPVIAGVHQSPTPLTDTPLKKLQVGNTLSLNGKRDKERSSG
jgi:hypothetical protein